MFFCYENALKRKEHMGTKCPFMIIELESFIYTKGRNKLQILFNVFVQQNFYVFFISAKKD